MKLPIHMFIVNSINKNRVAIITLYVLSVCSLSITNLDILRFSYILSYNIGLKLVYIDLFPTNVIILYPLKTPENQV